MSSEQYDDGLVHGHAWATEKPAQVQARRIAAPPEDAFDDGLVHGHAWASAEHGQPAGAVYPAE